MQKVKPFITKEIGQYRTYLQKSKKIGQYCNIGHSTLGGLNTRQLVLL